ncbi:MAG: DUF4340 domain-containing protein [Marinobacter sp.]|uniref:DUF4340 domain-containing protein n=1 Tax=Marinobacter sp. TaxID=50741 RepID=UPI00299CD84A|nr:DUF4340 domain-containing protein [Marinobacter sp.]MDX1755935.1 DUF4340 domain-containing protein [Marinobacter sp.]
MKKLMKQPIKLLSAVLMVQLALTGIVWSSAADTDGGTTGPLVAELEGVTAITLADPEEGTLTLTGTGEDWLLSGDDVEATRADNAKVTQLIDRISTLSPDFPVARSDQAQERFKVAEDAFRRRLTLDKANGDVVTLLVGTSPAMGESHVRLVGEAAIYRVALPVYDLPVDENHWKAPAKDLDEENGAEAESGSDYADPSRDDTPPTGE